MMATKIYETLPVPPELFDPLARSQRGSRIRHHDIFFHVKYTDILRLRLPPSVNIRGVLRYLRKKLGCGGWIEEHPRVGEYISLQGTHRSGVRRVLFRQKSQQKGIERCNRPVQLEGLDGGASFPRPRMRKHKNLKSAANLPRLSDMDFD